MAKGPTFNTIAAAFASASKLNANNAEITTAFSNTLSRDGSTPNNMIADFDMNSNNIVNVSSIDVDTLVLGGTTVTAGELPAAVTTHDFDTKVIVAAANVDTGFNFIRTAGFSSIGDGGGALYKAVGSEPSHALKVQSADGQWWEGVVPSMTPEMFGAAGDGVTNDLTKLQDMFDCPVSDTIMFGAGKTYYYETNGSVDNLTITRGIHLYTNGSMLHHKMVGGSNNNALVFETTMANEETWTETISAHATVLTITSSLSVGDKIFLELGAHPNDATVADVFIWATITANGGTTLTIDKPVPFAVNGTGHSLWPVTPNQGAYIDVLRITQEGDTATALLLESVLDFTLGSYLPVDVTTGVTIIDGCEGVNIGIITGNGRSTASPTSARVLTSWGSKIVKIGLINWKLDKDGAVILLEAGSKDFYIDKFEINRVLSSTATVANIHVVGESELRIGQLTVKCNKDDALIFDAASTFSLVIDELVIFNTMTSFQLKGARHAKRLQYKGVSFVDRVQLSKRTFISNDFTYDLDWFYGVPRRVFVRLDDTTKVDALWIKQEDDTLVGILTPLTSGEWTDVTGQLTSSGLLIGTRFRISINGKAASEAVLDTWVEYWRDPDVTELSELAVWGENRGEVTDTTDGSGDIDIAHGLGGEPRTVHVQMQGSTDYTTIIEGKTSTTFTVRVFDTAGNAKTSTAVTVSWSAAV